MARAPGWRQTHLEHLQPRAAGAQPTYGATNDGWRASECPVYVESGCSVKRRDRVVTTTVPFKKAINQITGKTSEAKALPRFRALLAEDIRQKVFRNKFREIDEQEVERILQEVLECYRKEGFTPGEIESFRARYISQPGCGPRKK